MNSGLNPANPVIVAAFRSALVHQWAIIAVIFLLLMLAYGATRGWVTAGTRARAALAAAWREPKARRLLRVGFGVLWLFDGMLQAQPQMAGGLPARVMEPAASTSPAWVQHLVNWAGSIWSLHPVQAGAASVWIQAGIGLWLILGVRGWPSRLAGLASVAWGLIVWVFAEAFGEIFAPGLTVLFGAPGAAGVYVAGGVLIAAPERVWQTARTGKLLLGGMGVFFAGMAVLQAWPGRGFWQGTIGGRPGTLTDMVRSMAATSQPPALSSIVSGFGNFTAAHGFAVNLVAVIILAALGAVFLAAAVRGDARVAWGGVIAGTVFCLADWVLVEDFAIFGGLGTDPNSMIPLVLLFTAGYLALTPAPRPAMTAPREAAGPASRPAPRLASPPTSRLASPPTSRLASPPTSRLASRAAGVREWAAALSGRSVAALGAVGVLMVGVAPMAFASVSKTADPIIAQAIAGSPCPRHPSPACSPTRPRGKAHPVRDPHALHPGQLVVRPVPDPRDHRRGVA